MPPAPDVPEPPAPGAAPPRGAARVRGDVLLFVPLILVLGDRGRAASAGTPRRSYYVGFAGNRVVIYKGVPGRRARLEPDASSSAPG